MARVLVVDDQELMRDGLVAALAREGHDVVAASDGATALGKLQQAGMGRFDLLISDLKMPRMTGIELLTEAKKIAPDMPVVLMTAYASVQTAVEAMKLGAYDYIQKPFEVEEIKLLVDRTLEHSRLKRENVLLRAVTSADIERPLVGGGVAMAAVRQKLDLVARSSATVLIRGESGTGKEVAARYIHARSSRADRPFMAVNCAALSENLLESELFGHEKGAFTGADRMRRGRFELADGGTLLLDEVSEISPGLQAKLLRVLQERSFERVGSSASQTVDVRVIATSNRDLEQAVADGKFREDLFYRLNVVPVELPPLRERRDDIAELARHFLGQLARRDKEPTRRIEAEARRLLEAYPWPGNVRELQNIMERAAVLETEPGLVRAYTIEPWLVQRRAPVAVLQSVPAVSTAVVDVTPPAVTRPVAEAVRPLAVVEKELILTTLQQFKGHRQKTAVALGIGVRTLGMKLKKWKDEGAVPEEVVTG